MPSHIKGNSCCRRHMRLSSSSRLVKASTIFQKGKQKPIPQAPVYLIYRLKASGYWGSKLKKGFRVEM